MILIRPLAQSEWAEAMALEAACWTEECAGRAENTQSAEQELAAWKRWMDGAAENGDVRVTTGAFEDGRLLGAAAASLAEPTDIPENGMELNGLWVDAREWRHGVAARLLLDLIARFAPLGVTELTVYNCHEAPSNAYYRHLGFSLLREDRQRLAAAELPVDVLGIGLGELKRALEQTAAGEWIRTGGADETERVLALYRSLVGSAGCTWTEDYPDLPDVLDDARSGSLFLLCSGTDGLLGAIASGVDDELDMLPCWSTAQRPLGLFRLGIRPDAQKRGLARQLLTAVERDAARRGFDAIRFLVSPTNPRALCLYDGVGYRNAGRTRMFDMDWYCYEKPLCGA